jgi:hypothetical protein
MISAPICTNFCTNFCTKTKPLEIEQQNCKQQQKNNMTFKKGQSGNPTGRPAGTKNKATEDLRTKINAWIEDNWDEMKQDYRDMEPEKRLAFFEKLLKYAVPPLQSINMEVEGRVSQELKQLSYEQVEEIAERILLKTNQEDQE